MKGRRRGYFFFSSSSSLTTYKKALKKAESQSHNWENNCKRKGKHICYLEQRKSRYFIILPTTLIKPWKLLRYLKFDRHISPKFILTHNQDWFKFPHRYGIVLRAELCESSKSKCSYQENPRVKMQSVKIALSYLLTPDLHLGLGLD